MGKPLDFIVTVLRVNTIEEDIIVRVGSIMKCLGYGSWLVLDMIQWFCSIGFFTINSETMSSINRIAPRLWLLGIASGALVNLHLLNKYLTLKKSKSTELEFKAESDKVIEKYSQNILQDFIDLLIPLSIMGWIPLTQGTVGLAGSITSLMGAYSIYPAKGESESK